MKTLKNLFLTILFTIGLVSTSFATKDTIIVASPTQIYHVVSGTQVPITSFSTNVGDTIRIENWSGYTSDFILNTTTFSGICGTMCGFDYKVQVTDVPSFTLKAVIMPSTLNLIPIYVNNITTGISENTNKIEFGAFPNPVTDILTVSASKELGQVTVINLSGQVVFTDLVTDTKTNIDFTVFAPGVYVVQVGGTTKKVIKQ